MSRQEHREITKELEETYIYKNAKYGDSFTETIDKLGMVSVAVRLNDKVNRINQLVQGSEDDESLADNLLDLANYSVMALMYMNKGDED